MMSAIESIETVDRFSFLEDLVIQPAISAGRYEVRFAMNAEEVQAAQALRYQVFYDEKHGNPSAEMVEAKRDIDQWDDAGFHVIVVDTRADEQPKVVGTLRLFFNECLKPGQHFYTEETFDLSRLHNFYGRSLELSRFCVDPNGRGGVILMLIWKYAMTFLQDNHIDVMFGCASFSGTDVNQHLPILNYLYQHHLAPEFLRPVPKVDDYIDLKEIYQPDADWADAQKSVPTLLRGYLKLGAKISDAAIIDSAFNTVYVSIYVETKNMLQKNPNLVMHV
ncbi:MAG: GNAT family N-acetyltransferase [Cellvibrionaceae bacterium]